MSCALLTVQCSLNYGATLQAVALYNALKEIDEETVMLDYRFAPFCSVIDKARRAELKNPKAFVKAAVKSTFLVPKQKKFEAFLRENVASITSPILNREQLRQYGKEYDAYICGSDQIWNPAHVHFDGSFFLDFVQKNSKKLSYAASIGKTELDQESLEFIDEHVKSFDAISVREKSAEDILESLGCNDVNVHCDPVFLRSAQWWRELAEKSAVKRSDEYVFIYRLTDNPVFDVIIKKLKEKLGFKFVSVTDDLRSQPYIDEKYMSVGPAEFLNLIDNARYVITDSFHGTAFSILFEKNLISVSNLSRNTRIEHLLKLFDMSDCFAIQDVESTGIPEVDYDEKYANAPSVISSLQNEAMEYLRNNL